MTRKVRPPSRTSQYVVGGMDTGIVCNSLENGTSEYYEWIKARESEGHEIWHHGYCHCKPTVDGQIKREFRGTGYTYQLDHLSKAQQLAKDNLDIVMRTFGAPYNSTDDETALALEQMTDIKIWLYKETDSPTSKYVMHRIDTINIEYPVHIPDFDRFVKGYLAARDEPILVIQGHPRSWIDDPERMKTFKQIVLYLKHEGVQFTTPHDYYLSQSQ